MGGDEKLSILTIILTIHLLLGPATAPNIASDDATIMAKLAKSLSPSGWTGDDPCDWSGVSCDSSGFVTHINLASKSLSSQIPSEIGQLSHLITLSLQNNQFSGPFPPLVDLTSLQQVFLGENNFTSVPSPFLKGLTSLQSLSIGENPNLAPWTLPDTLADSTTLTNLSAESAKLMGSIPDIFGSLPSLQNVRLSYNNLTGLLPPSMAKSGIRNLWINNQEEGLSGRISMLWSMTELNQVWLHGNQFTGAIPDLSAAKSLFDLSLHDNRLTGPIPASLTTLPKLANVSLQNNMLQGPFPSFSSRVQVNLGTTNNFCNSKPGPCDAQVTILLDVAGGFGYPMALAQSWSGNNPCQGWKSVSCDTNGKILVLNFGKQGFAGHISPSVAKITTLTNILLNDNNLTGVIPLALAKLPQLRVLDISNNNISGKVPSFDSGVTVKTSGNPLIGKDVPIQVPTADGSSSESSSSGTSTGEGSKHSSTSKWVIPVIIIIIIMFILAAVLYVIYTQVLKGQRGRRIWERYSTEGREKLKRGSEYALNVYGVSSIEPPNRSSGNNSSEIQVYDGGNVAIPIEVLREVTDNFSESNILGRGGFGVVYKGVLHDGTKIAVKRMEAAMDSTKGLNEFQAEIAVLSKVRHRHLVALYGFCIHGNERLLVYEHMPQGTLGQRLFSYTQIGVASLSWKQRVQIALDVARGVEYLHSLAQQSFIHRDLKPSNVLLGDDMRAKVSDFGLVKNAPDGKYSVETRLAGTFGYLAPEYASTGRVTTKIDVFAFGVILMEIITGRRALDESLPDDRSHLVSWFRKYINHKDSIQTYLDPSLDPDEESFESICKVAELSGHCTAREPHQRPDMGHAVNVLSPLVEQWKPTGQDEVDSFGIDFDMSLPQALQRWQAGEGMSLVPPSGYQNSCTPSAPQGTSGVPSLFSSRDTQ